MKAETKKPKQYSKIMCDRSWWLLTGTTIFCIIVEGLLQYLGRGSMKEVVTIILSLITFQTVFINGGYVTLSLLRDISLNKNGIHMPTDGDKHYIEPAQTTPTI